MSISHTLLSQLVTLALDEDLNYQTAADGDITAQLIPQNEQASAKVITREDCIFCGKDIIIEVFKQVDPTVQVSVLVNDGDVVTANSTLFTAKGSARAILTAERTALNFVQTLSGTVKCGGGANHRIGLFDAFLIKENHIAACGGIEKAVAQAKLNHPSKPVEVEVESLQELKQAIDAGADIIMLDNFSVEQIKQAVVLTNKRAKLEVSGNMTLETLKTYSQAGVDFISSGALTKNLQSIDLSMRFE